MSDRLISRRDFFVAAAVGTATLAVYGVGGLVDNGGDVASAEVGGSHWDFPRTSIDEELVDVLFGRDPLHEIVVREMIDPGGENSAYPIAEFVEEVKVEKILRQYREDIETNGKLREMLNSFDIGISASARALQAVFSLNDFESGKRPDFSSKTVKSNVVFIDNHAPNVVVGGGLSAFGSRPAILYGRYAAYRRDILNPNYTEHEVAMALANLVHEGVVHQNGDLIKEQKDKSVAARSGLNFDVVHMLIGIYEDIARLGRGIAYIDIETFSPKVVIILDSMVRAGIAPEVAIRQALRVGGGFVDDVPKMVTAYNLGAKGNWPDFYTLVGGEVPKNPENPSFSRLINTFRSEWAKVGGVSSLAY